MKRRGNGEGTIFKDKNGRWRAMLYVSSGNGAKKRIQTSAKSYEAIKKKVKEIQEREKNGLIYTAKGWTVAEGLDYWLYKVHIKKIRENTLDSYERAIKNHIKPVYGGYKVQELTVRHMRLGMDTLEERGVSGRMRNEARKIMSAFLQWCMTEELIMRNVARLIEKPQHTPKKTVIWAAKQASFFIKAIREHRYYIVFVLFFCYGLRRCEDIGLRYCDIDFENNVIHVRQQIGRIKGKLKAWKPKTKESLRTLPLIPFVRSAILAHAEKNGVTIPPFDPYAEPSLEGTIVVSSAGTPLEPRTLGRVSDRLQEKLGLRHITLHAMRHMLATFLKDMGVPLKDAQIILGHTDSAMTLWYQHENPDTHRSAISALGQNLLAG